MRIRTQNYLATSAFVVALAASSGALAESAGQYIDDTAITTKVKAALLSDNQLKATQISVQTNKGTVELSGSVNNKDQESEAVRAVNQISGVRAVKDLLMVKGSSESED